MMKTPRIEESDKLFSKIPRVAYDEFENLIERNSGKASLKSVEQHFKL